MIGSAIMCVGLTGAVIAAARTHPLIEHSTVSDDEGGTHTELIVNPAVDVALGEGVTTMFVVIPIGLLNGAAIAIQRRPRRPAPPQRLLAMCPNGHVVRAHQRFCTACGIALSA